MEGKLRNINETKQANKNKIKLNNKAKQQSSHQAARQPSKLPQCNIAAHKRTPGDFKNKKFKNKSLSTNHKPSIL